MVHMRDEVKQASTATMEKCGKCVGNIDIDPFIPTLIECIHKVDEVPECVHKLAATTFVQQVEAPTLSIMGPRPTHRVRGKSPPTGGGDVAAPRGEVNASGAGTAQSGAYIRGHSGSSSSALPASRFRLSFCSSRLWSRLSAGGNPRSGSSTQRRK
mgnify:CR=1 FL=1